jgi:hypothetical protein
LKSLAEGKGTKNADEAVMDLLAKMSEAYMKCKQENAELSLRLQTIEQENDQLKKQV